MNKTELLAFVGDQLRQELIPHGLNFVLVCCSQDSAGRAFWQSEASRPDIIVPLLRGYLEAIDQLEKFDPDTENL